MSAPYGATTTILCLAELLYCTFPLVLDVVEPPATRELRERCYFCVTEMRQSAKHRFQPWTLLRQKLLRDFTPIRYDEDGEIVKRGIDARMERDRNRPV